jgi:hypothetical protein
MKITKILIIIILISCIDFILSFIIDYLFKENINYNEPFAIYVSKTWYTSALISLLAVGITAFFYLLFYVTFVDTKYMKFYKNRGGIVIFIIISFCFMGAMIFSFMTNLFGMVNLLRLCSSAWMVTYFITKVIEEKQILKR